MAKKLANGEGNIRKRKDGRWEGRCTAGYDPAIGKRIIKNVLGRTQAEVKEEQNDWNLLPGGIQPFPFVFPCGVSTRQWRVGANRSTLRSGRSWTRPTGTQDPSRQARLVWVRAARKAKCGGEKNSNDTANYLKNSEKAHVISFRTLPICCSPKFYNSRILVYAT